ncbi:hypothetical protein BDQ17DRAFT_799555 [Cyathus striatus]|nr:hypothetical protein BDQ17DRAFT_957927 [Cyathus striatus]KAF9011973.1 hypothetical protein BDQ17DRAFT_799555 [Cyathus striatus]
MDPVQWSSVAVDQQTIIFHVCLVAMTINRVNISCSIYLLLTCGLPLVNLGLIAQPESHGQILLLLAHYALTGPFFVRLQSSLFQISSRQVAMHMFQ